MKNKYILFAVLGFALLLGSCKVGSYSQFGGQPNQAYLLLVSNNRYSTPVDVTIDGVTHFEAKVLKEKKGTIKGNTYAINPGTRNVVISKDGNVLYSAKIFVSTQETKKIQLP